jgi:hypothetical protein
MSDLYQYLKDNNALIEINSVEECLELFSHLGRLSGPFYYYRGLPDSSYRLLSTLDRFGDEKWGHKEKLLLRQFKKIARNYVPTQLLPNTLFEWLSLMQHYGVPTRLLDLTTSPFIALYFAVNDWDSMCDGALWAFNPYHLHESSLHRLRESNFPYPVEVSHGYHLPEFIQEEYFTEAFTSGNYRICLIIEPEIAEKRLFQQQGAFLVTSGRGVDTESILTEVLLDRSHLDREKDEMLRKGSYDWSIVKVIIPSTLKKKIFTQLLNIKLAPFGRTFNSSIFHGLPVTAGTTKNRHNHISSLKFGVTNLEIDDRLVDPYLTAAHGTAVVVFLRRGAKGNILPLL